MLTTSLTGVGNKTDFIVPEAVDTHKILARLSVRATCHESKKCGAKKSKAAHLKEKFTILTDDTVTSRCEYRARVFGIKCKRIVCRVTLGSNVPALLAAGSTTVGEAAKDSAGHKVEKRPPGAHNRANRPVKGRGRGRGLQS